MKKHGSKLLKAGIALIIAIGALAMRGPSDDYIRARVVKLRSPFGSCSGEQIRAPSGTDYILTAAHCKALEINGQIEAVTEDGKHIPRRVVSEDPSSDLLLLEGLPNVRGLDIADFSYYRQDVRSFTHGAGFDTYKTYGVLIQLKDVQVLLNIIEDPIQESACRSMPKYEVLEVPGLPIKGCILHVQELVTTAFITKGSSGGPVVNSDGDLVGVVSAGGEGFGYLVPLQDIRPFIRNF